MPKVSAIEIDKAANKVYSLLVSILGLCGARKAQLQVGRLIQQEKARREKLDGGKKRD